MLCGFEHYLLRSNIASCFGVMSRFPCKLAPVLGLFGRALHHHRPPLSFSEHAAHDKPENAEKQHEIDGQITHDTPPYFASPAANWSSFIPSWRFLCASDTVPKSFRGSDLTQTIGFDLEAEEDQAKTG